MIAAAESRQLLRPGPVNIFQHPGNGRVALDDAIPVSYTHLDVYKRQVIAQGNAADRPAKIVGQGRADDQGVRVAGPPGGSGGMGAVSYTHLDVYKRQPPPGLSTQ